MLVEVLVDQLEFFAYVRHVDALLSLGHQFDSVVKVVAVLLFHPHVGVQRLLAALVKVLTDILQVK